MENRRGNAKCSRMTEIFVFSKWISGMGGGEIVKDFQNFLSNLETQELMKQSRARFNDILNNQGLVAKNRIHPDDANLFCSVDIMTTLLENYHAWLHDDADKT